ncbi:MAG TPA: flagellar hook-associated protein FlgK [Azospira sp.]|nr:flagellar hook-associated protein FlgK [Azospira sp.]
MSNGLFGIGITGVNAAQLGMLTTGNNIANVDTPGYNRQRISQSNNIAIATGAGFIGQGSRVDTITRIYNSVITNQINQSQTKASELSKYYDQIKQIDNMLADDKAGLSPTLQDLFKGVQAVASNPALTTSRDALVSSAQTFTSRLQNLESRLSAMYAGVNSQLESTVSSINSYAKQIADLNERIITAQAAVNQPANSLLDERDQLIADLNKEVAVTTVEEANGSMSVFIGTGQQLVVGTRANTLAVQPSSADPQRMAVGITTSTNVQELPEYLLSGGNLGGLLAFRSESLDKAANSLGQVAASLALTFNAQHALGQDMLGNIAGDADFNPDFFTISDPKSWANALNTGTATVSASFVNPPPQVLNGGAFSLAYDKTADTYTATRASDGTQWPGYADLNSLMQQVYADTGTTLDMSSAHYATNITASDYRLTFDGANYTVTRQSDNKQWSNADPLALSATVADSDGISFSISAGIAAGDSFLIQPTREIARNISVNKAVAADSRLFAASQPVRSGSGSTNTGSGVISAGTVAPGYTAPAAGAAGTVTMTLNGTNLDFSNLAGDTFDVTYTDTTGTHTVIGASSVPYTNPSTKYTVNGITFEISGNPANNDTFTLSRNTGGVSDGRNANLLGQLQTQGTVDGGATTYQASYARLVSAIGNKTRETQVTRDAQQALADQGIAAREAQSGVNLDEEAANLLKFQQAYQASAKMISIASDLFNTILAIRS